MRDDAIKTKDRAMGHWRGLLLEFGVPAAALTKKNCPCPLPGCGGTDRFRFIDTEGRGTWVCNVCGGGDGFDLLQAYTGRPFKDLAAEVDRILGHGNVPHDPPPARDDDARRAALRAVWAAGRAIERGDLVDRYLSARGCNLRNYPAGLRYAPDIMDGDGGRRPAMLARVVDPDGRPATIHRTFLHPSGERKAEMEAPRKVMPVPGELPAGACVRLIPWVAGPLGIAEGIETALAAARLFRIPVWATLNAALMAKWEPPADAGLRSVVIFADNDANFAGQAAAYRLANRLVAGRAKLSVDVRTPGRVGWDWQDWLVHRREIERKGMDAPKKTPMEG